MASPTLTYEEILAGVRKLEPVEQLRLLETLAVLVRQRVTVGRQHSILELRGLGKEIWQDIDVQAYIDEERDSWDG
ncbi:MAG: hypothetical protein M3Q65_02430 [Chloroflexota bacterium]|nr:hypothetical protein [Chloroflexota bacterium]